MADVKWRTWELARDMRWGPGATLTFENREKETLLIVREGWMADRVRIEANGLVEMDVNVLYQSGVEESVLRTVWFLVLVGRRYEKRTYEPIQQLPSRHNFRFDAIGELV